MKVLSVAKDFSRFPAGRYLTDGPHSGERFRAILATELRRDEVTVLLDGTLGYGSSFLEEAFGGLVRECAFTADELRKKLHVTSSDSSLTREVWAYIGEAHPARK